MLTCWARNFNGVSKLLCLEWKKNKESRLRMEVQGKKCTVTSSRGHERLLERERKGKCRRKGKEWKKLRKERKEKVFSKEGEKKHAVCY